MDRIAARLLLLLVLFLTALVTGCGSVKSSDDGGNTRCVLYAEVDSMLNSISDERELAQWRIASLQKRIGLTDDEDEVFILRKQIVEEFILIDEDSALWYSERNMALARRMYRPDRVGEIHLRRSYIFTVWGDYDGSKRELDEAWRMAEFDDMRIQCCFQSLYNALCAGDASGIVGEDEVLTAKKLQQLLKYDAEGNMMLWSRYFTVNGAEERGKLREEVDVRLGELQPDGAWTGHLGYVGGLLAFEAGDMEGAAEYMCRVVMSLGSHVRVYASALRLIASQASEDGNAAVSERIMEYYQNLKI